ncbi:50S ribosomal protein L19 [Patescibacteria group bacterium]|nr:50S ribosomal protein L19 [Patescibacteria group bacterium]MBU1722195.1 50S ribosomal protein L19 [Patescibacteria group bacterium]MBU1901146.1 50S ribosomal protein L19 [Patescibacteria group bacterium]
MEKDIRSNLKPGMIVRVHLKIKDINKKGEEKERVQVFEGIILVVKHGNESGATFTVRKVSNGIGVERIFPIYSPLVTKIEVLRQMKVNRACAYYLRSHKNKLKEIKKTNKVVEEAPVEVTKEEKTEEKTTA